MAKSCGGGGMRHPKTGRFTSKKKGSAKASKAKAINPRGGTAKALPTGEFKAG